MTYNVELSLAGLSCAVQCDDFCAEKVLARSDAARHGEVHPTAARNHPVDAPFARAIQTVLCYLQCGNTVSGCLSYDGCTLITPTLNHLSPLPSALAASSTLAM